MYWEIDKTFECCYGHRVWAQKLNGKYSDNLTCKCRFRHGHQGTIRVHLYGEVLDKQGMVTDFRHTEWLKRLIDSFVDHKFIVDKNDPAYDILVGVNKILVPVTLPGHDEYIIGYTILVDEDLLNSSDERIAGHAEVEYGTLVVDFIPTSENLSKWIADLVDYKMKELNVAVSKVEWWETPKSRATYHRPKAIFKDGIRQ